MTDQRDVEICRLQEEIACLRGVDLVAELGRLRAENERLKAAIEGDCDVWDIVDAKNAEIERLQKLVNLRTVAEAWGKPEIERLRRDLEIWRRNGGDILMRAKIADLQEELRQLRITARYWQRLAESE